MRKHFLNILQALTEASTSELLENLKERFHHYYMQSDVSNKFKYSTTQHCFIRREGKNITTIEDMLSHYW